MSSEYFIKLSTASKVRYEEKIEKIEGTDPFSLSKCEFNSFEENYPNITYPDIVNYLLFAPCPISAEEMKCYKGLEAYNQFLCGWVKDIGIKLFNNDSICLIRGRVLHSQRVSDTPTQTWVISESNGKILSAHCDCMAGLGEACSHIGAILFYLEASHRIREAKTVTDEKAYWMLPSSCKDIKFAEVSNIDFTSPNTLKRKYDVAVNNTSKAPPLLESCFVKYKGPTDDQLSSFFDELNISGEKPAILSIIPPYDNSYVPKIISGTLPKMVTDIYNSNLSHFNIDDLRMYCSGVGIYFVNITIDQQREVETLTRLQAENPLWFKYRAGRITASKIYSAVHTNPNQPAISLLRNICYPQTNIFSTPATKWGIFHEDIALKKYCNNMTVIHTEVNFQKCGLFLSTDYPFLGATPDLLVNCLCCGDGCVEVKCPFKHKDSFIIEAVESDDKFCLKKVNGRIRLSEAHSYFYQIQSQLHVCNKKYCDFIIYTNVDFYIERIMPNNAFWLDMVLKCKLLFNNSILPEMVAKYFTRERNMNATRVVTDAPISSKYCFCDGEEVGELFACNNKGCLRKLFHLKCVNLKNKPKRCWLCPDCRN